MTPPPARRALRWIALFELAKGLLVLLTGTGLLALLHRDLGALAASLVRHSHLNPAAHLPHVFIESARQLQQGLQQGHLLWLALGALAYAAVRIAEAWGLWFDRAWAEWLAALSGAIYLPFELLELLREGTPLSAGLLVLNLAVVALMVAALRRRQRASATAAAPPA